MARYSDHILPKSVNGAELIRTLKSLKVGRHSVEILEVPSAAFPDRNWKIRVWGDAPYALTEHQQDT